MATEEQIRTVINSLADVQACSECGTRFRFGDMDCPHCGAELDDHFRQWAEDLLQKLGVG